MSGEDAADDENWADEETSTEATAGTDASDGDATDSDASDTTAEVRDRIEEGADRAAQQIDESVVDLLAWILDTETRARIYVELRQHPDSTSEEIADGTGLYPSTVREALAELHEEGKLERRKRESDGAGNNPYEYRAMAPTELVRDVVGDVQQELNTVFNLDTYLGGEESDDGPVKINVEEQRGDAVETGTDTEMVDATDDEGSDGEGSDDESIGGDGSDGDGATDESGEADSAVDDEAK